MIKYIIKIILFFVSINLFSQNVFGEKNQTFTKKDSLFGSNNENRKYWDVLHYDLYINPDFNQKFISGKNIILAKINQDASKLDSIPIQIDLQDPMKITKILFNKKEIKSNKKLETFYFFKIPKSQINEDKTFKLEILFEGNPHIAEKAPWDGGWIFTEDKNGNPFMSVACQGIGASIWLPVKDFQDDKADFGANISILVDKNLVAIANGKLISKTKIKDKINYSWKVTNPINAYNIIPYIGKYLEFKDNYEGLKGNLDLNYWVLEYNLEKAKNQFQQVKPMIKCFEDWFGAYPFYEDSYKLVEAPYLGMEHQSNVAYGNNYENGYLGRDLSGSGVGLKWDFIIIHESGHEWFGNSITSKDVADMWIHEAFTSYSEVIFTESLLGKDAANKYVQGIRQNIQNDIPIIGKYNVRNEGSGDMYFKGSNMIHIIRQLIDNDEVFKDILRGLNKAFYHKTVSSKVLEYYLVEHTHFNINSIFNQYLRTTQIPILEIKKENNEIFFRWTNCIEDFDMKLRLKDSNNWIYPTTNWQKSTQNAEFKIDPNFYIKTRTINFK